MQLDQTRIVIRERQLPETLDLSLRLLQRSLGPLCLLTLPTAVPLVLADLLLAGRLAPWRPEDYESAELIGLYSRYFAAMGSLLAIQAPLLTLFVSSYLGHLVFEERPSVKASIRETIAMWPKILWCFGVRRGVILAMILALFIEPYAMNRAEICLILLALMMLLVRAARPYLPEIVLLERSPLRKNKDGPAVITIAKRNASLHNPNTSDLVGRWIISAMAGLLLGGSLLGSLLFLQGVFFDDWAPNLATYLAGYPLTVVFVTLYMTVFRFLSYLNLRIRQEGWEVELLLRAEAARMRGELSGGW